MSHDLIGPGCSHGKKWAEECQRCDRVWGHSFMTDEQRQLATFYDVNTLDELVIAQARHIERLQAKLPPMRDEFPRTPREG